MTKIPPLVSVLMTVYNREKYVVEAIESVIASTYQNWELIIVDDCSQDNSVKIAQSYATKDNRIKVHINETNLGDYPNRNKAASYAKGKYLKYLDADDIIYPHGLSIMAETMEMFPDASYGLSMVEQEDSKPYPLLLTCEQAFERHYLKTSVFHKSPLGAIIRKVDFDSVGGFTGKQHVGDFELWNMLAIKKPIVLMTGGLAWYRNHDQQQMNDNRNNPIVPFKYYKISLEQLQNQNCPLKTIEKEKAINQVKRRMSRYIFNNLRFFRLKAVGEMKALSQISWFKIFYWALKN